MADDTSSKSLSGQTGDTRPAPGAMNAALGRTSMDLATDQPAGFGPDPIAGADDRDTFSGTGDDPGHPGARLGGKERKFNPDIPPDARLGLAPTVAGDPVPHHPVHPVKPPRARAMAGFLAGAAAAAVLAVVAYLLALAGLGGTTPTFVGASRVWLGQQGAVGHVLGVAGFVLVGGVWGALFGLLVARPTFLKGMLFGILPTLFHWLVLAPLAGAGPFSGGTAGGIILPLVTNVVLWGGLLGYLCERWLAHPTTAAT